MLIGVDIGTQSLKVAVTDPALALIGAAQRSYQPSFPAPGRAEQDPRAWEDALSPAIAEALAKAGCSPGKVSAIAICGQLDGCIAVDDSGAARGPCISWMDRRATQELDDVDTDHVHKLTGIVPDASHLAAKIRWLKRHDPEARRTARYHQPVSYMVECLTGEAVIDHALASTSMLYGLKTQAYEPALLAAFEVNMAELPAVAAASAQAGRLTSQGAALTGLPTGIPVAVGTGDDFSTPLGAGLVAPGQISVAIGTGEVVGALFTEPVIDEGRLVETHAYPAGGYFVENPGWLAGGAVAWLKRLLRIDDFAEIDRLAASVPVGSDGLIFLPALTGAMAPEWDADVRGCFYGLTPSHGAAHLARAMLEGCGFAMRDVLTRLETLGARPSSLTMLAGGARSRLWAQIRADIADLPATLPRHAHSSVIGAAMLAGVASGAFATLTEAARLLPPPQDQLLPDPTAGAKLDQSYQRYLALFAALKSLQS
jgi:xylulokinase